MSTPLAALAVGTLAITLSASPEVADLPVATSAESAAEVTEKVLVRNFDLDSSQLKYLEQSVRCPPYAPFLDDTEYHPGSGYLIPRGVSLEGDLDEPLLPNFPAIYDTEYSSAVGLSRVGSIHNLSRQSPRYVQVYMHCTDQQ